MNNRKQLQTPRINIYISIDTKKYLQAIQDTYFISYSTITNIIFEEYIKNGKKFTNLNDLLFDKNTKKTSIKPRMARYLKCGKLVINNEETKIHPTNLLSNLLFLTQTNKIKTYVENYEKFKTNIYNRFKNTDEKFYKYNHFSKNQPRFIKQNKEYVKKLLGE